MNAIARKTVVLEAPYRIQVCPLGPDGGGVYWTLCSTVNGEPYIRSDRGKVRVDIAEAMQSRPGLSLRWSTVLRAWIALADAYGASGPDITVRQGDALKRKAAEAALAAMGGP